MLCAGRRAVGKNDEDEWALESRPDVPLPHNRWSSLMAHGPCFLSSTSKSAAERWITGEHVQLPLMANGTKYLLGQTS